MGSSPSKTAPKLKNVFARELAVVTDVVNSVITDDNQFVRSDYNFLSRETCSKYTFLLESQLKRHMKLHIQELHDSILMVPKQTRVAVGSHVIDKDDLCEVISAHYLQILYLVSLIKFVLNTEHGGDFSMAGIVFRNIRVVGDLMEIHYCAAPQKDYARADKKVDLNSLQGMKFFIENFLSPEESQVFLQQLKMVFARTATEQTVLALACRDTVLQLADYETLYDLRAKCGKTNKPRATTGAESTLFHVGEMNFVLSGTMCMSRKKLVVQLNRASQQVKQRYQTLLGNYRGNLKEVEALLGELVHRAANGKYTLHNLDNDRLQSLIHRSKRVIMRLYLQPLIDSQALLDSARKGGDAVTVDLF